MSGATTDRVVPINSSVHAADRQGSFELLQLPETALDHVLQKLDFCSLASITVCCSRFRHAFTTYTSQLGVRCRSQEQLGSFTSWLNINNSRLSQLTQCTLLNAVSAYQPYSELTLNEFPCPQLRRLRLEKVGVHLGPTDSLGFKYEYPGVLQVCRGLTALDLDWCNHWDIQSDFAAIAALPELQHLRVILSDEPYCCRLFPQFRHPQNLTYLSISYDTYTVSKPVQHLSQLSALVNLQHLGLYHLPHTGIPGGWPSQLVKLTCLYAHYRNNVTCDVQQQFQHLSCLTALQHLIVSCSPRPGQSSVPGIQHLPHLISLKLEQKGSFEGPAARPTLEFSTAITHSWACRTALRGLTLIGCLVQPQAPAALTQLQALYLVRVTPLGDAAAEDTLGTPGTQRMTPLTPLAPAEELLLTVSQLTALKALEIKELSVLSEKPLVLHLTALTALLTLDLINMGKPGVPMVFIGLTNKAPKLNPPDVWIQLLRRLLPDAACRQVLLKRSSASAAAPPELMLAQLAATLAEELAACSSR